MVCTQMVRIVGSSIFLYCCYYHPPHVLCLKVMTYLSSQKKTQIPHNISGSFWLAKTSRKTVCKMLSQSEDVLILHQKCRDGEEKDGRKYSVGENTNKNI